jgi:hypothetical protein
MAPTRDARDKVVLLRKTSEERRKPRSSHDFISIYIMRRVMSPPMLCAIM